MTSANEEWQEWVDKHWPKADTPLRRVLWDMWRTAINVGRKLEREKLEAQQWDGTT